jgi:hypothetical protein
MQESTVLKYPSRKEKLRGILQRFMSKEHTDAAVRSAITLYESIYAYRCALRFGWKRWEPKGRIPTFLGYYPDSFLRLPHARELYRRWIKDNKVNNNGDAARFAALMLNLRQLCAEGIEGDFAELGVWKGNSAAILADFAASSGKRLFLFDTFSGFDKRDLQGVDKSRRKLFTDTSIDYVKENVQHTDITTYVQGFFPDSLTDEARASTFALAHIDCDLYKPMKAALEFFYPRMPIGSMMIMHDYSSGEWSGATEAINEFCKATGEFLSLWPDKSGTAMIRKTRPV